MRGLVSDPTITPSLPHDEHKATFLLYFQVETIGDAYMVARGLPVWNGTQRVDEIATTSLHFLSATICFQIGHMPEEKVKLWTGLHTGSQH